MILKNISSKFPKTPLSVSLYACHFDHNNSSFDLIKTPWGVINIPPSLHRATHKRKNEFLAGRYCTFKASQMLGWPILNLPINHDRSPLWPDDWVGSISHSANTAASIVGKKMHYLGLGLDVEQRVTKEITSTIKANVVTEEELNILQNIKTDELKIILLFSAKEAIYKAIYPTIKTFVDYHKVSCIAITNEQLIFTLSSQHSRKLGGIKSLSVSYNVYKYNVVTTCIILQNNETRGKQRY